MDVTHLLTEEMVKARTKPTPIAIYEYNKRLRGGDFAEDWPEEKIFRHLNDKHELNATDGVVTLNKRTFTSPLLKAVAKHHKIACPNEEFRVTVYTVANAPLQVLWDDPTGNLRSLDAEKPTALGYPDSFKWQHDFINRLKNANYRAALDAAEKAIDNAKRSSSAVVSAAEERILKKANGNRIGKPQGSTKATRESAKAALDRADVQALVDGFSRPNAELPARAPLSEFPILVADEDDDCSFFTD
jgi:hypothetical protein